MLPEIWNGNWKLIDFEPASGRNTWMTVEGGDIVIRVYQPTAAIFSANQEAEAATHGKRFGDWNRIASIPHHLVYKNGVNDAIEQQDDRFLSRFLNNSDNSKFRTSRGKV